MWFILQAENCDIRFKFNCQITYMMFEILKTIFFFFSNLLWSYILVEKT